MRIKKLLGLLLALNIYCVNAEDRANFQSKMTENYINSLESRVADLEDEVRDYKVSLEDLEFAKNEIIENSEKSNDFYKSEIKDIKKQINFISNRLFDGVDQDRRVNETPFVRNGLSTDNKESIEKKYAEYDNKDGLAAPSIDKSRVIQGEYKAALNLFEDGKYYESELSFKKFIEKYNKHNLVSDAYYWLAESFYKRNKFEEAGANYLKSYRNNALGDKSANCLFKLSKTLAASNKFNEACAVLYKLSKEFPFLPDEMDEQVKSEKQKIGCKN